MYKCSWQATRFEWKILIILVFWYKSRPTLRWINHLSDNTCIGYWDSSIYWISSTKCIESNHLSDNTCIGYWDSSIYWISSTKCIESNHLSDNTCIGYWDSSIYWISSTKCIGSNQLSEELTTSQIIHV